MHVEMSLGEAITLMIAVIGAVWGLLKIAAIQFNKGLDARFAAQNEKLAHIDSLLVKVNTMEADQLRRELVYRDMFVTKEDQRETMKRSDETIRAIFDALRRIEDKMETKVSRDECGLCANGKRQ